ncbi:IMP dehydrogenase [Candidatus Woesearchaeota archaeon]|nr:IMP dehydrogenase [Candidatus Woesearchaeota archaeon]
MDETERLIARPNYADRPARTFLEYRLEPRLSGPRHANLDNLSLRSPLVRFKKGEKSRIYLNVCITTAIMQAVTGTRMKIEAARHGMSSMSPSSQPIDKHKEMVYDAKKKRGVFQKSRVFFSPDHTLADVLEFREKTGYSTIPITYSGKETSKLVGIVCDGNTWPTDPPGTKVKDFMTPFNENYPHARLHDSLDGCKRIMRDHARAGVSVKHLPVVDSRGALRFFIFKKDFEERYKYPMEVIDDQGRYVVGAGANITDFKERIPELVDAGVDYICFDSSNAFKTHMADAIRWAKKEYPDLIVGAGNIVGEDAFTYLAQAGADFVKIGMGGGSICITQEQTGLGKGQATALQDVKTARDEFYRTTKEYVPIISDGGIVQDAHIAVALAMGADHVMMGRYFARFDESPTEVGRVRGRMLKPYWGEGSKRARNWMRYTGDESYFLFEQGVDGFVPYAGPMAQALEQTIAQVKTPMSASGSIDLAEFRKNALIQRASEASIREGKAHDILLLGEEGQRYEENRW